MPASSLHSYLRVTAPHEWPYFSKKLHSNGDQYASSQPDHTLSPVPFRVVLALEVVTRSAYQMKYSGSRFLSTTVEQY